AERAAIDRRRAGRAVRGADRLSPRPDRKRARRSGAARVARARSSTNQADGAGTALSQRSAGAVPASGGRQPCNEALLPPEGEGRDGAGRAVSAAPYAWTLRAATRAIVAGAISSAAYTRSLLERIAATHAKIQAWAHLDREAAMKTAAACDAEGRSGALAGAGIGVKDIIATADQPTQMGSPIYAGARPTQDAECVARLKRAGA